jgi:hypothetical protein
MNNIFSMTSDGQIGSKKIGRVFFESQPKRFVLVVDFGPGAGYIGGRTFYLARNSGSAQWRRTYRPDVRNRTFFGFEIGLTVNANRVPYLAH